MFTLHAHTSEKLRHRRATFGYGIRGGVLVEAFLSNMYV